MDSQVDGDYSVNCCLACRSRRVATNDQLVMDEDGQLWRQTVCLDCATSVHHR